MTGIDPSSPLSHQAAVDSLSTANNEQGVFNNNNDNWNGRELAPFQFIKEQVQAAATTVSSFISSFLSTFQPVASIQPRNRIDTIFEELRVNQFPTDLIKQVLSFDQDNCNNIISILLQGNAISDDVMSVAKSVTVLDLTSYPEKIKDASKILQLFENVEVLTIKSSFGDEIEDIAKLKKLKSLDLEGLFGDINCLLELKDLQKLRLEGFYTITEEFIDNVSKNLTSLQSIDLPRPIKITDASLVSLSNITTLQSISLGGAETTITDAGLMSLEKLPDLKSIHLERCYAITDAGLASLEKIQSINSFHLTWVKRITKARFCLTNKSSVS